MPSEESYKKIEGDWKDFKVRRIEPQDHEAVFEHIANQYCRDEPSAKLLGWSKEFAHDTWRVVKYLLKDKMSFLVEHMPSGKIAGLRITFNRTPEISYDDVPLYSRNAHLLLKFADELEARADVSNRHGIQSWAEFLIVSTSPDFQNQGIASELYDRSITFLKAEGYKHVLRYKPLDSACCTETWV